MNFAIPLKLVPHDLKINFVDKRGMAFGFSIIITIMAIGLLFFKGLNLGIDFAGGLAIEVENIGVDDARQTMDDLGYNGFSVQQQSGSGANSMVLIRVQPKDVMHYTNDIEAIKNALTAKVRDNSEYDGKRDENASNGSIRSEVEGNIENQNSNSIISFQRVDYVGPKVGRDFVDSSIQALIVALLVMMAYTWFRFEWQFGVGVIIALLHDAIATLGFYSISRYEFDLTSVAAILTIIGYSINDSVVIYDRIRENLKKHRNKKISEIINISINETLSRTLMTVATTLLVCAILAGFGGSSLRGFSMATFFGIAFGTYSSIYISAPILILLHHKEARKKKSN